MAFIKRPNIGVYESKTRNLQAKLSYERTSLTWKTVNVYKYVGVYGSTQDRAEIEDKILFETRNREYDPEPVELNCHFEPLQEEQTDLSRFGIINPLADNLRVYMHTYSFQSLGLNRYIKAGDVLEIPFWGQYGDSNVWHKSFWEVIEVDRKPEFETFSVIVTCEPLKDRQETQDLQDLDGMFSNSGVMDGVYDGLVTDMDTFIDEKSDIEEVTNILDNSESRLYNPTPNFIEDWITDNKIVVPPSILSVSAFDTNVVFTFKQFVVPTSITTATSFGTADVSIV